MDIRLHYDLPNDCIVDVEIRRPKELEGHIVSILARKGRDSLTKYVLQPTFIEELTDPQIHIHSFDITDSDKDVLLEIYGHNEKKIDVYFYLSTLPGCGTLVTREITSEIKL